MEVKKKIRPGVIQLHEGEAALLVHYEVQEVSTAAHGSQEILSSSQATKKITVKSLSERTDLQALATEIVDKCKLIHPSKTGLVQGLLQQLQRRELGLPPDPNLAAASHASPSRPSTSSSNGSARMQQQQQRATADAQAAGAAHAGSGSRPASGATASAVAAAAISSGSGRPASARPQSGSRPHTASNGSSRVGTPQQQQQQRQRHMQPPPPPQQQYRLLQASEAFQAYAQALTRSSRPAFLDDLEVYIEGLYEEELPQRAAAADMLCQLFKNSSNLQALLSRETLLSTLARLLREDGPRSLDMATAVAGCFYACSCMKDLHRQLLDNQVGSLLMDLVALELQRTAAREAQEGPGSSAAALAAKAAATAAAVGKGGGRQQQQPLLDQREFRLLSVVVNQDRFLFIALATLLNLAEEPSVQRKMVKKDVIGLLLGMLGRPHLEVLLLVTSFLRRLCIYTEGKARLSAQPSVVPQMVALLQPGCGEQLQCGVLRLLHNLSFDGVLRQQMMGAGLVQQAVPLLDGPQTSPLAAGLLYQLSMDDEARTAFCFCPGALNRLLDSILRALGPSNAGPSSSPPGGLRSIPELIALAVNVAHSNGVAEWFLEGDRLERLLQRALATADELAWKLLRNLAASGGSLLAPTLLAHADGMLNILQSHDTGPELFVEVLGTLSVAADAACGSNSSSNAAGDGVVDADGSGSSSAGVPPWQLMRGVTLQELLAFLVACFQQGALEDDALLEAVVLLGALAGWTEGDTELADSGLLPHLVDLLPAKRSDDEFVLQVCWAFRRALMQPASTRALLAHDQVVMYLVDLVQDPCVPVSRVASGCLDVIIDLNDDMAGAIRSLKFEAFNQEWLKLAGPEAHQLMAAAAAWQQQQLQAYIQQIHHQQQQMESGRTPFSTVVLQPDGQQQQQQQQQQRRGAVNGYFDEQQQQYDFGGMQPSGGQSQFDRGAYGGGHANMYAGYGDGEGAEEAFFEQQQQQQQQQDERQLQWVNSMAADGTDGVQQQEGCLGRTSTMGRASMVTAAGQTMVLDFDAFVADAGVT